MAIEIRLHGRGGQGGVTCAKILAAIYAAARQERPDLRRLRRRALGRAGARLHARRRPADHQPQQGLPARPPARPRPDAARRRRRSPASRPAARCSSTAPSRSSGSAERFPRFRVAAVDATAIARRHGIGTRIGGDRQHHHRRRLRARARPAVRGARGGLPRPRPALEPRRGARGVRGGRGARGLRAPRRTRSPAVAPGARAARRSRSSTDVEESRRPASRPAPGARRRPRYVEALAPCSAWCPAGNDVSASCRRWRRGARSPARKVLRATTSRSPRSAAASARPPAWRGATAPSSTARSTSARLERWIARPRAASRAPAIPKLDEPAPRRDRRRRPGRPRRRLRAGARRPRRDDLRRRARSSAACCARASRPTACRARRSTARSSAILALGVETRSASGSTRERSRALDERVRRRRSSPPACSG